MTAPTPYDLCGSHPAARVLQLVRSNTLLERRHGDGAIDPVPTTRQVAAVLRALADYTHNAHMVSDSVGVLGADEDVLNPQATALGRYFLGLADELRWVVPDHASPAPGTPELAALSA